MLTTAKQKMDSIKKDHRDLYEQLLMYIPSDDLERIRLSIADDSIICVYNSVIAFYDTEMMDDYCIT